MNKKRLLRKSHRYIALIVGLQLFLWSIGGFYFSLFPINEIHGDHYKKENVTVDWSELNNVQSYASVFSSLTRNDIVISDILNMQLVNAPVGFLYRITLKSKKQLWVNPFSALLQDRLTEREIFQLSSKLLNLSDEPVSITLIEQVAIDHEYRGKPLPVYQLNFNDSEGLTAYIEPYSGEILSLRTNKWRIFDFLWMLHVMDYETRDNFHHLLLQIFALLAVITSLTGIVLWFVSHKRKRHATR